MATDRKDSLMTQIRKSRGLSLAVVAEKVGTDAGKRELARSLFQFYGGAVPLASIYDPAYEQSATG
jgi:hypothetical protein